MNFTPYAPRPLKSLGVIELRGYRLKAYSILYGSAPLDRAAFDAGLALAQRELPTPAVAPGRPGLGFVIFHQGRSGPYLILAWWDNENELPVRVFLADPPPNGEVAAATGRPASAPAWRPPLRPNRSACGISASSGMNAKPTSPRCSPGRPTPRPTSPQPSKAKPNPAVLPAFGPSSRRAT